MSALAWLPGFRGREYLVTAAALEAGLVIELAAGGELFFNYWAPPFVPGLLLAASLAVWNRLPWLTLLAAVLAVLGAPQAPTDGPISTLIALVLVAFLAGWQPAGRPLIGMTGVVVMAVLAVAREFAPDLQPSDIALPWLLFGGPWLAGLALRLRDERDAVEARARADEAAAAVRLERARIARELHDAVAHAIGIIVIQARGGRRALPNDPAAARESLDSIDATAATALAEMRQLVGVLREGDERAELSPAPRLTDLEQLVGEVRTAGLPITLTVLGEPAELPAGLELSAYRLVQEALTNVLAHAGPAKAEVTLRYRPTELEIEVANTGRPAPEPRPAGHGLIGMQERVALYGGQLDVEPRSEGGFVVRARLPLRDTAPS